MHFVSFYLVSLCHLWDISWPINKAKQGVRFPVTTLMSYWLNLYHHLLSVWHHGFDCCLSSSLIDRNEGKAKKTTNEPSCSRHGQRLSYKTYMRSQGREFGIIRNASCEDGDKQQEKQSGFDGYSLILSRVHNHFKALGRTLEKKKKRKTISTPFHYPRARALHPSVCLVISDLCWKVIFMSTKTD